MKVEYFKAYDIRFDDLRIGRMFTMCGEPNLVYIKFSTDKAYLLTEDGIDFTDFEKEFTGRCVVPVRATAIALKKI